MGQEVNMEQLSFHAGYGQRLSSLFRSRILMAEFCTVARCIVQAMGIVLIATNACTVYIGQCPPVLWVHLYG